MNYLRKLFASDQPHPLSGSVSNASPQPVPQPDPKTLPAPIARKVLMITHNPKLQTQGGRTLKEYFGWNDSNVLAQGYIDDVRACTYGYANYEIVERIVAETYPLKRDGFRYTEQSYLDAWRQRKFHDPDGVDYLEL